MIKPTAPMLTEAEIIDDWLAAICHHLSPFEWTTPSEAAFRRKCFCELALYLSILRRLGEWNGDSASLTRLHAHVIQHVGHEYNALARRNNSNLPMYAMGLAYARRYGDVDDELQAALGATLSSPFLWSEERPPFRQLDLLAALSVAGVPHPVCPVAVTSQSSLAFPPSPAMCGSDALYALTHCIFYAGILIDLDLGRYAAQEALRAVLNAALSRALYDNDTDLGLELVASQVLLGLGPCAAADALLSRCQAQLISEGRLTALPSFGVEAFLKTKPAETWAHAYHVMIVAGIALAVVRAAGGNINVPPPEEVLLAKSFGKALRQSTDLAFDQSLSTLVRLKELFEFDGNAQALESLILCRISEFYDTPNPWGSFVDEHALTTATSGEESVFLRSNVQARELLSLCTSLCSTTELHS